MNHLPLKEKWALIISVSLAVLILVTGIYDFLVVELMARELVMSVGVFSMLLSIGLMPKLFFTPVTHILKSGNIPTVGNPIIQHWLSLLGILLCSLSLVWRLLL